MSNVRESEAEPASRYAWRFLCQFGEDCYKTWRQELLSTALVSIATYLVTPSIDDGAVSAFRTTAWSVGAVFTLFCLINLFRSAYRLRAQHGAPKIWTGYFGLFIVILLAGGLIFGLCSLRMRFQPFPSGQVGDSSYRERLDAITPSPLFKRPEYCSSLPFGEFRPECYQPSGTTTSADVAFDNALSFANANKMTSVLRLGPHVYPMCKQWVEPEGNYGVSIIGEDSTKTSLKAVCFIPKGPMIQIGKAVQHSEPISGSPVDWCRESMDIEVNDGNFVENNTVSGGKMRLKAHNKNVIRGNYSSCDPNSSMFRGFILETAKHKDRIEILISAVSQELMAKWTSLPIETRQVKQSALNDLIAKIRSKENDPTAEMDLLVQLHDMN